MQQNSQNIPPNQEDNQLVNMIRENIGFQMEQSFKRTLMKESLMKISMDKDFQNLFQQNLMSARMQNQQNRPKIQQKQLVKVTQEMKEICSWLEESEQHRGAAYLPYNATHKLINIMSQKVEGTTILISQYPQYWMGKMQEMSRLSKLRWAVLSQEQEGDQKIKVLQLYELNKLKVLLITPNIFKTEEYHQFQCDLLIFLDLHLYRSNSVCISQIINKTSPGRVLTLYHTLMPLYYSSILSENNIVTINQPKTNGSNMIVLKVNQEQRFKAMMTYISKNEFRKVVVIVRKKQEATFISKKLYLQSQSSYINLFEELNPKQMNSFSSFNVLKDKQTINQKRIQQIMGKMSKCNIVITKSMDFLKFCQFDLAVYYSLNDVVQFTTSCFTVRDKVLLFEQSQYYSYRNQITSKLISIDHLQHLVTKLMETTTVQEIKNENNNKKLSYSSSLDDKLMNSFTVNKFNIQKEAEKVVRINAFCNKQETSRPVIERIIQTMQICQVIQNDYRTVYEIEIEQESLARLKKIFPSIKQIRRKINLLNTSTSLQKTIKNILQELNNQGIRYKITQQAIQMRILSDIDDINWQQLLEVVNKEIYNEVQNLDKSFQIMKNCAYGSIQLAKRQKTLNKKQHLLNFYTTELIKNQNFMNSAQSYHLRNMIISEVEEWIRGSEQDWTDQQALVLFLQGVDKGKFSKHKEDSLYGRYRKIKYEELIEIVSRIYGNKKIKTN